VRQSDSKLIRALPLFSGMSEENFGELMSAAFLQRFPKHVALITEGGLPDFLHIVVEGSVEMFCVYEGQEITIEIMQPVTTFILAAVIRDDVYLTSARTLTPAQVLMMPAKVVRDIFGRDVAFAHAIVNELALRFRGVVRALKNGKLRSGSERLANWILHTDTLQGNLRRIRMTISKRALASSLGMTPENLSRNFAVLAKYGVKSSGRTIEIEDTSALERFAKPNSLIDG
jgi:CRP/FNR family transcriptional activator FtrB